MSTDTSDLGDRDFTCAQCGGTFEKGWTDEEAAAEAQANFSATELEDTAMICDDCYGPFMAALPRAETRPT